MLASQAMICAVDDCDRPVGRHGARGWCPMHYRRWKQHGTTDDPRPSEIERFWRDVRGGGCWLWVGVTNAKGYGIFYLDGGRMLAHRYSYQLAQGEIPINAEIDHRPTCSKNCVNPLHLRPVTKKQNAENRAGAQANSTTGIRGVSWCEAVGKWRARARSSGVEYVAGYFDDIQEAEQAVIDLRNRIFTHNDMDRIEA